MVLSGTGPTPAGDRRFVEEDSDDSRSSSSLGRDSDEEGGGDLEVESSYEKKGPLDTMDVLEEALPIKRGISKFYEGKSKSFTSLADAISASSIKEFAKPGNPFARKYSPQRNSSARNSSACLREQGSGISRKTANACGSSLVPELTTTCSRSSNNEDSYSMFMQSSSHLPPLHPLAKRPPTSVSRLPSLSQNFNCRSFSLSDLRCAASASSND